MTDESIPAYLSTLGQTTHNQRLETRFTDVPWVLLVSAIDLPPNRARLRGHLDDPAYAQCPYAERIFVVEAVVEAFADTPLVIYSHRGDPILPPPPSVATWPVYTDALLGFHLPIPPGATVVSISATDTLLGGIELSFASGDPIRVRVWDEALFQDPQAPDYRSAVITRYPGEPWTQNSLPVRPQTDDPPLVGYLQMYPFDRPHQHQLYRVLFGANDRTYTVEFVATLGAEADQVRHLTYGYLVGFFGLTAPQGPTPTVPPPMFSTAPFLSAEVAWGEFQAVESPKNTAGLPLTYEAAWLLTEAAYRKWNADAGIRTCAVFEGHAAGIWLYQGVVVHPTDGLYLQATALDAQTAKVVCSSSLSSEAIALLPPPNP